MRSGVKTDKVTPRHETVRPADRARLSWLVIPEQGSDIRSLTLDRVRPLAQKAAQYDVEAVFLHALDVCDFLFLPEYPAYTRRMGDSRRRADIETNIAHLNALEEKDRAAELCRQSLRAIEAAKADMTEALYVPLHHGFELELNCIRIWRLFAEVLVRHRMYVNGNDGQRETVRARLEGLAGAADDTEQRFGGAIRPGKPAAVRAFVSDVVVDMGLPQF